MLFYISVFITSVIAALVAVYLFYAIMELVRGASGNLTPDARGNQKSNRSRSAKRPVKSKSSRDKSTPWGWGNNRGSARVAGMYSASSRVASSGSWSNKASESTGDGKQKTSGFDRFLNRNTVNSSPEAKTEAPVRTTSRTKGTPWGW